MLEFNTLQTISENPGLISVCYTIAISFLLSTIIAITYEKTFRGLAYSRNYLQALILSSVVAAIIMQSIGDSLARGLGMIGALAIVRFRTNFKDSRDIIFMFASLGIGIASGVGGYSIAFVGAFSFSLIAFLLYLSPFGSNQSFDGILRFNMASDSQDRQTMEQLMKNFCQNFALITLKDVDGGSRMDCAYHVKLRHGKSSHELVSELGRTCRSLRSINLLLQETTLEV